MTLNLLTLQYSTQSTFFFFFLQLLSTWDKFWFDIETHAVLLVLPQTTKCLVLLACLKCNVINFDDIQKSILENHLNVTTQILNH